MLPVPEPHHRSQKTKEHARLPPTGYLRLPPGESWYQVFCFLTSHCHCSQANPGSGRSQEGPGQGRLVKDAPPGFPPLPPWTPFPIIPATGNSESSLLIQTLLNKIHLQKLLHSPGRMGRPCILAQAFLKSFLSMTAPNSSDLCPLFWEA